MENINVEQGPVFIGGLANSGKTPLRRMLSRHPNISMSRRTYMWRKFYKRYGDLDQLQNFNRCLSAMLASKGVRVLLPDAERIRREFNQGMKTYSNLFALFHKHYAERLGKKRWGDQLGLVECYTDIIFAAYPSAKMIHMICTPRDYCEVILSTSRYRKGKVGWSTAKWLYSAMLAQRNQDRYPDRYKVLRYETLMTEPEETLQAVCKFLNETCLPEMIRIGAGDNDLEDANGLKSSHKSGSAAWKKSVPMSKRELAFSLVYTRPQMLHLDYLIDPSHLPIADRLLYCFVDWPANRAGMLAWQKLKAPSLGKYLQEI